MSHSKRTTNYLALHLQMKDKCPIEGHFHFPFASTSERGEGKKKISICLEFQKWIEMQLQLPFLEKTKFMQLFLNSSLQILNCLMRKKTDYNSKLKCSVKNTKKTEIQQIFVLRTSTLYPCKLFYLKYFGIFDLVCIRHVLYI